MVKKIKNHRCNQNFDKLFSKLKILNNSGESNIQEIMSQVHHLAVHFEIELQSNNNFYNISSNQKEIFLESLSIIKKTYNISNEKNIFDTALDCIKNIFIPEKNLEEATSELIHEYHEYKKLEDL